MILWAFRFNMHVVAYINPCNDDGVSDLFLTFVGAQRDLKGINVHALA